MDESLSDGFSRRPRVCLLVCFRLPKAIWSILPVIIWLSQRLIRACLSSNCSTVKQPMAHGEVMTKKNNTGLFPRPFDWNK